MNVHLVSHLTHYVRLYSPLWTHSCFMFESLNGYLMQLKHGTQHIVTQVRVITSWAISYQFFYKINISGSSSVVHYEESDPWLGRYM